MQIKIRNPSTHANTLVCLRPHADIYPGPLGLPQDPWGYPGTLGGTLKSKVQNNNNNNNNSNGTGEKETLNINVVGKMGNVINAFC